MLVALVGIVVISMEAIYPVGSLGSEPLKLFASTVTLFVPPGFD